MISMQYIKAASYACLRTGMNLTVIFIGVKETGIFLFLWRVVNINFEMCFIKCGLVPPDTTRRNMKAISVGIF
jgi:hypothetical protein